jgi:hypothetical protein
MDKEECIEKSKIKLARVADCYTVFVASKEEYIGSPTNTLTPFESWAACFKEREKAASALEFHCDPSNERYIE